MPVSGNQCMGQAASTGRQRGYVTCRAGGGGRGGGREGGGGRGRGRGGALRQYKASDGTSHLGSSLDTTVTMRPFPGPPPADGPPLRVLPIGGLGEIGMNCMMVGVNDRYIVIDAGLMFPDFSDLGMQKILPDTSFLAQWRDKVEAVVITHGHEDHIGALPWVVPALDPNTPIYTTSFVRKLVQRRLTEYSLWNEERFKLFDMRVPFQAGPFEVEAMRVTHSIPDCCGLVLRCEHGTIVHTGDWKIDENPVDGAQFDRDLFHMLSKEPVALMMSDSTNVLSTGRTTSESVVSDSILQKVLAHQGKGRVICTQFASNLHRMYGVKRAADAAGRRICFVGMSLNHYLEAAWQDGRAPFSPRDLIDPADLASYNDNEVLIVTTGSQAEPRAQLSLASRDSSNLLKIKSTDLLLYSAKVIPGNEGKVTKMLNSIAMQGATIMQGRHDMLHTSGHAYQDELTEVLRAVQPQSFLPVHGEYSFLCEHARLAREKASVKNVEVIKNGQLLGVAERRNRNTVSSGSLAVAQQQARALGGDGSNGYLPISVLGEVDLVNFYNDGNKGTGTAQEMALEERSTLAFEGIVVVDVTVVRDSSGGLDGGRSLRCRVRCTARAMWTNKGELLRSIHEGVESAICRCSYDTSLPNVERLTIDVVKRICKTYNNKKPEVIAIAHEYDPRAAVIATSAAARSAQQQQDEGRPPAGRLTRSTSRATGGSSSSSSSPAPSQQPGEGREEWGAVAEAQAAPEPSAVKRLVARRIPARTASNSSPGSGAKAPPLQVLPDGVLQRRRAANPRDAPSPSQENDPDYG